MAADVSQDLGLEAELADGLAILAGLLRGSGRGKLNVVDTKVVEGLGNLDLGLGVEEGVGELLALSQGGLNYTSHVSGGDSKEAGLAERTNLVSVNVAEEVANRLVGVAVLLLGLYRRGQNSSSPVPRKRFSEAIDGSYRNGSEPGVV